VLMVDEPLAGLDPRHTQQAARRLQELATGQGKLVIASVHDLTIVLRRATRVWALKDGKLLADGPVEQVMNAALLRELFDVEASVAGTGARAYVDF